MHYFLVHHLTMLQYKHSVLYRETPDPVISEICTIFFR